MEIRLPPDFKDLLKLLNDHDVRYLLIGGYSVAYHGYPRATNDLDIWIQCDPDNIDRVISALRLFGFNLPELNSDVFFSNSMIRMGVPPLRIEFLTEVSGVSFDDCYSERIVDDFDGVRVNLISLKRLLQNKQASGRHKDLNDIEHLPHE